MWSVDPKKQLVLVTRVEVIIQSTFAFTTDPLIADNEVTAGTQSHENVIVQISEGNNILETELQYILLTEAFCV